jgi:hypothetical protein
LSISNIDLLPSHIQKKDNNAYNLYSFCDYTQRTPAEPLALKDNPASKDAEKMLDDFRTGNMEGFSNAEEHLTGIAVKSFFMC